MTNESEKRAMSHSPLRGKKDSGRQLYYRQAPQGYIVFAPPERAILVDQIHRAIGESTTWGEFRKRLPAGEYKKLYGERFSADPEILAEADDAREPADDEPFSSECVPGFSDGDYPPWLAAEQDRCLPSSVLKEFATRESSFVSGSFWCFDIERIAPHHRQSSATRLRSRSARRPDVLVNLRMTATAHIDLNGQTYTFTTNVGSGRVRVAYPDGPLIAMWDPRRPLKWAARYEGFFRFECSGHSAQLRAQLARFDLRRRQGASSP